METKDLLELIPIGGICSCALNISPEISSVNVLRNMFTIDIEFPVLIDFKFINIYSIKSLLHNF